MRVGGVEEGNRESGRGSNDERTERKGDQVICADLDNDGFDEIIISRTDLGVPGSVRVFRNTTGPQ